uniref:Uncharacterized protein U4 n=1 Tax=Hyposoter didymator TaxID=260305 RepID=D7P5M2_HYPDD|nr:unknown [Hyposoter didymator]
MKAQPRPVRRRGKSHRRKPGITAQAVGILSTTLSTAVAFVLGRQLWRTRIGEWTYDKDELLTYRKTRLSRFARGFGYEEARENHLLALLKSSITEDDNTNLLLHVLFPYLTMTDESNTAASKDAGNDASKQ